MKKLIASLLCLAAVISAAAQEEKEMKTGWSLGILPTATFSADNGFQAGAFGDIYNYGDGSTYPDPLHKISWEASYFTKSHRMRLYLAYDSKYLIPNMRVNASITYMNDPLYSFWGFNGGASLANLPQTYDKYWSNKDTDINYFGMSRKMLRILANVQGRITDNLNWAAGINFWNWKLGQMNDKGYKGADGNTHYYDKAKTLYQDYMDLGIIHADEANGGNALEINAGVVYDTRDIEAAPNHGIWAEAYLNGNVLQHQYLKACVYFRQYIDIPVHIFKAGDPVFAYRLAWQQTIAGETPVYMIQNIPLLVQRNMITEGYGSTGTIRGLRDNRILTEGMAWANLELRVKLVKFTLFNQYFYIAVNPFFDAGVITKAYRTAEFEAASKANWVSKTDGFNFNTIYDAGKVGDVVYSAGAGLKIAWNQNFIISAEFAKCFYKPLDAGLWIGIGVNYCF